MTVTGFLCFIDSQKSHTKHLMIIGKSTAQLQAKCPFKLILECELFSWLKTLPWLWNADMQNKSAVPLL
jgi:hypothetical protein